MEIGFIALGVIILLLAGCAEVKVLNYKFMKTSQICKRQDDIRKKILTDTEFSIENEIDTLSRQFVIDTSFFGYNAVHWNNIAVRNHLLLSVLHHMRADYSKAKEELGKARELIDFNTINTHIWAEGPSYYLYTEEMIDLYLEKVEEDEFLIQLKKNCREWLDRYITPDNMLPPIGETRRQKWEGEYDANPAVSYDSEQTLFKTDNVYLLVRHPSHINRFIFNGHTHFDVGNIVAYYCGKRVLFHVGYPGYEEKKGKLADLRNQNSVFLSSLRDPYWRMGQYRLESISRTDNSVRLEYIINGRQIVRIVSFEKNKVRITDTGVDGINLNFNMKRCDLSMLEGRNMRLSKGYHAEEDNKIVENSRIIANDDRGIVSIEISMK